MKKEDVEILQRIDSIVWNELVSVLTTHPEESLHATTSPEWTSKDVFAHMARWLNYSNNLIENYCVTGELPDSGDLVDELNTRWQREDKGMELEDAKGKAFAEFSRRQRIIASIPLDKWNDKVRRAISYDGATHYAAHLNYIVIDR
jgi:hypothetical protein